MPTTWMQAGEEPAEKMTGCDKVNIFDFFIDKEILNKLPNL